MSANMRKIASSYRKFFNNLPIFANQEIECSKCGFTEWTLEYQKKYWIAREKDTNGVKEKIVLSSGLIRLQCTACGNQQWAKPRDYASYDTIFKIYNDSNKQLIEETDNP